MIHVTTTVVRDGAAREMPLRDLVPGDMINLAAPPSFGSAQLLTQLS